MKSVHWKVSNFADLKLEELYRILEARQEVFVVEQKCIYLDCDFKDQSSLHLFAERSDKLAAYCRIVPPGLTFSEPSIGRVITTKYFRKGGYGRELMKRAIQVTQEYYPSSPIRLSAQAYLERFYSSFGFEVISEQYLEDGIEHVEMLLSPTSSL